jgi:YD repeat-containing protein
MSASRWCAGLLALAWSVTAAASVSLRNGNFFIGYTDIAFTTGGVPINLERVYNSKTPFTGMFGVGWGTPYEVRIARIGDGSLLVHEHGGGAENLFFPRTPSQDAIARTIDALVGAYRTEAPAATGADLESYRVRLRTDATWRAIEWERLRARKLVEDPLPPPEGEELISNRFSHQVIRRVSDRYERRNDDGTTETFDADGRLIAIADSKHNRLDLSYRDGKLASLKDGFGHEIALTYEANSRLVTRATGSDGKVARYRYNDAGEMVEARDADGNTYNYQWSSDGRHNLTSIGYSDGTAMSIWYYPLEMLESVRAVRDRDGTLTTYRYEPRPGDKPKPPTAIGAYAVIVEVEQRGQRLSRSRYDYYEKIGRAGSRYLHRMVSDVDGDRTDTTYATDSGLPLQIVHNRAVSRFEYNKDGRVTLKQTSQGTTRLSYDTCGKVSRVGQTRSGASSETWSAFEYDPATCDLRSVRNSAGDRVDLTYDAEGRIAEAVRNEKTLRFEYNREARPIRIEVDQVGALDITYTPSGEVENVDSKSGRAVALEVTSMFQSLLELIRPADVKLTF